MCRVSIWELLGNNRCWGSLGSWVSHPSHRQESDTADDFWKLLATASLSEAGYEPGDLESVRISMVKTKLTTMVKDADAYELQDALHNISKCVSEDVGGELASEMRALTTCMAPGAATETDLADALQSFNESSECKVLSVIKGWPGGRRVIGLARRELKKKEPSCVSVSMSS